MAEAPMTANQSFLQGKWGPLPVWAWGALGLVVAYMYNKYRANQQAATTPTVSSTNAAAEGQAVAPQFVIEENEAAQTQSVSVGGPPGGTVTPSGPITPPVTGGGTGGPIVVPIKGPPPHPGGPPIAVPPSGGLHGGGGGPSKAPIAYHVPAGSGESYSSIAKKFGYKGGGQALYQYNITSSPHTAQAKRELKGQGPNLLHGNQIVYVPQ